MTPPKIHYYQIFHYLFGKTINSERNRNLRWTAQMQYYLHRLCYQFAVGDFCVPEVTINNHRAFLMEIALMKVRLSWVH